MKLFGEFETQEEIDAEYDLESVLDMPFYGDWMNSKNRLTRQELNKVLFESYGPTRDEFVDIFPSMIPNSPVLVFIHGGWWRSMSAADFHYVARGLVKQGITAVLVNYSLCPKVSVSEITRQNRAAISWVHRNIQNHNGNPDRLFVAGHSAGGHQVGMLLTTDWEREYGLPAEIIKGGIPISGLFDLRPFYYSWLQPKLLLSHDIIQRESPLFHLDALDFYPPLLMSVGGDESQEFHRQTNEFAEAWISRGGAVTMLPQPKKDHISAISDFVDPTSDVTNAVCAFIQQWSR